ncbi:MAG: GNAT family N-acetyltransferase [Thermoanaerobaculia bacterium]
MKIRDLRRDAEAAVDRAADLLVEGFAYLSPQAWPDRETARKEVLESLEPDRVSRVAVDGFGTVLGWVAGIRQYDGHVWELHPLVVDEAYRRRGIGRALVADLEVQVRRRGAITLWLGTDDESDRTTLSGVDLFPDVLEHLAGIRNLRGHPYEFYQRVGFSLIGVMPDANGFGKPDILMAKRVGDIPK